MITAEDYENQEFGWFRILKKIGGGAEAEVFECHHMPTGRVYVLRLHIEDDEVWERTEPMLPPRNYTIEHNNARGTVAYGGAVSIKVGKRRRSKDEWTVLVTQLYGVRDNKYLLPVSNTYQRRGAVSFERLLDLPLPFDMLPFWENLGLLAQAETGLLKSGTIPIEAWQERWGVLLRDARLRTWTDEAVADLPPQLRAAVDECLNQEFIGGPSLEQSAVARIVLARLTKTVTKDELAASLSCPFFRMNITLRDLHYTMQLLRLYSDVPWLLQGPVEWLGASAGEVLLEIANGLIEQPDQYPEAGERFEKCAPPSEEVLSRYDLIVQDFAASKQQYLSLERS
jgi:hypothetical protein